MVFQKIQLSFGKISHIFYLLVSVFRSNQESDKRVTHMVSPYTAFSVSMANHLDKINLIVT